MKDYGAFHSQLSRKEYEQKNLRKKSVELREGRDSRTNGQHENWQRNGKLNFLVTGITAIRITFPPKISVSWSPEPVTPWLYMAKGLGRCDQGKNFEMILDYLRVPSLIIKSLPRARRRDRCDYYRKVREMLALKLEEGPGTRNLERWIKMENNLQKGAKPCGHLGFSSVRPVEHFWPPEL